MCSIKEDILYLAEDMTEELINLAAQIVVDPTKLRVALALSFFAATATLAATFYAGQLSVEIFPPKEDDRND